MTEEELQTLLDEAAARHGVPGAALGLMDPAGVRAVVTGITNARTGAPVLRSTMFQIGSISKVWTATLAMQLVDEGRLDLDTPVRRWLPELGDSHAGAATMRMLLEHTSGLECDLFMDTGRGDDALERWVARMVDEPALHPLGETWTYCNTGFMLAGRVIEVIEGADWDTVLRRRLIEPLALPATATLPEHVLLHSAALGHVHEPGAAFRAADDWFFPRCVGPAGSIVARIDDLLAFTRMHLADGVAEDGTRVLSRAGAQLMREQGVALPALLSPGVRGWGLGWGLWRYGDVPVVAHTGGTIGQYAFLDAFPERGAALALLTNGGDADALAAELRRTILPEWLGVTPPPPLEPIDAPLGEVPVGRYRRYGSSVELRRGDSGYELVLVSGPLDTGAGEQVQALPLRAAESGFVALAEGGRHSVPVRALTLSDGRRAVTAGTRLYVEERA
ncbi:MAG: serine hydrolase domain-containing protein [Microbacteriaceae bacterium]